MKLIFIPLFFCLILAFRFSETSAIMPKKSTPPKIDLITWYDTYKTRSVSYRDNGEIDRAIQVLDSCINFAPGNPNLTSEHEKLGWIYVNRAYLFESYLGNFHEAKKSYLLALKSFHNANTENFLLARYLYQPLGNIHTRFGENEQAIRLLEQFIQIAQENDQTSAELNGLNDLGRAYMNKKEYSKSIEILQSGILKCNNDFYNKGLLYSSLAESYSNAGQFDLGISSSEQSLSAFSIAQRSIPKDDFRYDQITRYKIGVLTTLGALYTKTQKLHASAQLLDEAEKTANQIYPNRHRKVAKIHLAKGDNYAASKDFNRALQEYHQALISSSLAFQNKNPLTLPEIGNLLPEVSQGEALLGKARILVQMDNSMQFPMLALKHYQKYFEWITISIQEQQDTYSKLFFAQEIHAIANEAIELTYQLRNTITGDSAAQFAYAFMDQSKGILLSQSQQTLKFSKTEENPEFQLLKELSMQLVKFQRELKVAEMKQNHEKITALKRDIAHLDQQKQLVGLRISQQYPNLESSLYRYDKRKIRRQLDRLQPHECLVNYFEGDQNFFSVVVENGRFHLYRLKSTVDQEVSDILPVFQQNTDMSAMDYAKTSHTLFTHLCPDVLRKSQLSHWIIIPDGKLHFLPFEALSVSNSGQNDWKSLKYLVKRKVISYAPTTATIFTEKKPFKEALFSGFAPVFEQHPNLPELIHSEQEIQASSTVFGGSSYLKKKATKKAFAQALKTNSIVHLSTHAGADTVDISNSWLAFHGDNNKLLISDLLNMEVNADLVVLNACETGTGKYTAGEGVMSLARSFLASGSNCVVTNLYQANHGVNADIFKRFYRRLNEVKSPASAMQQSKVAFLRDGNTDSQSAHPRNWATPVVMGSISQIEISNSKSSVSYLLWFLISSSILVGILLIGLQVRKNKT